MMVTKLLKQQTMMRCCSVMLVLSLCVSLFAGCSNGSTENGISTTKKETLLTTIYEDVLYIADSDGTVHTADFYGDVYSEQTSMDGSKYIAVDDDEYTLLYFNGEEILTLADNIGVAVMSADGNAIAYVTLIDEESRISELYLYADGESRLIDSGAINMCAISPNGSAVGYTTEVEDENYRSYYWDGSEIHEIGKHRVLIALSNGGEYIYYAKLDEEERSEDFYVQQGDDSATKMKLPDIDSQEVYFNRDATELMFSNGEKTYIVVKSEELVEISAEECSPVFPDGVLKSNSNQFGPTYITYDVDSFAEHFYRIRMGRDLGIVYYGIVYMDQAFQSQSIVADIALGEYYITKDEQMIFYNIANDASYKFDANGQEAEPVLLHDKPWEMIADDGNSIYYQDFEETWDAEQSVYVYTISELYKIDGKSLKSEHSSIKNCSIYKTNEGEKVILDDTTIPDGAELCTIFHEKILYELDGNYYCLYNGKTQTIKADPNVLNRDFIHTYDNIIIAFDSEQTYYAYQHDNSDKSCLAGCYFSVDGVNFMPLVKNYVPENN